MNLVIPTYNKHFAYNRVFLDSFRKFCDDKDEVTINFILSSEDEHLFSPIKEEFKDLKIKTYTLSYLILKSFGQTSSDNVHNYINKYPLQSLKKLLIYTELSTDFIVLDSENVCLKNFHFKEIFEVEKNKPILFCKEVYYDLQKEVMSTANEICNIDNDKWFFLKSYWYYELENVEKLFSFLKKTYGNNVIDFLKRKTFFDYQLYSVFLTKENLKKISSTEDIVKNMGNIKNSLVEKSHNFEYIVTVLDENNIDHYVKYLNTNDEKIVRLHWLNDNLKNKIIETSKVCIGTFHWD